MKEEIAELIWDLCGLDSDESMWGYDQEQFAYYLAKHIKGLE